MVRNYAIGFIFALILTSVSFMVVIAGITAKPAAIAIVTVSAVIQMLVHLHYFLHLKSSSGMRWNIYSLLFAILLVAFFIGGTIWVMFTLNQRMM